MEKKVNNRQDDWYDEKKKKKINIKVVYMVYNNETYLYQILYFGSSYKVYQICLYYCLSLMIKNLTWSRPLLNHTLQ